MVILRSKPAIRRLCPGCSWAWVLFLVLAATASLLAACTAPPTGEGELESATPPATLTVTQTQIIPTQTIDRWMELFERDPYPWTTPLPPSEATILDGTYTKVDPIEATPFPCVRCPDYQREGGIWKLNLDKGVYRIYHPITSWRSIASYTVSGDRLFIFNDPYCPKEVGVYRWTLDAGMLTLETIQDTCAIDLRPKNLSYQPWLSCHPPNVEAAITDHWQKPPGCENN
jgi:hypothetical protein